MALSSSVPVYSTGIYARLSVLDNGKQDGDSIHSQIALLERFVDERPYLALADRFIDNGFSGTDFDRPQWDRLMEAVKAGRINCVVVKDLSRLGRNYIEAGQLLEKVFPYLGVRFISINDGYDSAALNSTDELSASLKNIVNDYYAKDISRKACTALKVKRQRGDYIGSYAPYGYQRDPENKNHLIIDAQTAPTVRQIFQMRGEGMGYTAILRSLNGQNIPSPGRYRYENGIVTNNNKRGSSLLWSRHVLTDLLHNIVYLGHLAQGRSRSSLYSGVSFHRAAEEEWDVVYNTHEPIISQELWEQVQALNRERGAAYKENYGKYANLPKEDNPYGGRLVCAHCGTALRLYRNIFKGGKKACFTYVCPTYEEHREMGCPHKKSIRSDVLNSAVLETVKKQMELFLDAHRVLKELLQKKNRTSPSSGAQEELAGLRRQRDRKRALFTALYTDYRGGILTRDEFLFARGQYQAELDKLEARMAEARGEAEPTGDPVPHARRWAALMEDYSAATEVTRELVENLITQIRVTSGRAISIQFSFEQEYADLLATCVKLQTEVA